MLRALPNALAIVFVLLTYIFFGSHGHFAFQRVGWEQPNGRPGEGYYASLAEGYLRGQLHLAHQPDPRLLALPHPYEYEGRHHQVDYLWDAAYLNGKYYLYHTSLPALIFYIPARVLTGSYPSDQLAATLFAAWAFVMSAAFLRRALGASQVPAPVWILTLGLANVVPFVLSYSRTYEVAILCGAAMTSTWAYALLRFIEQPSNRRLLFAAIWLALAIASRPNLGILVVVFAVAIVTMKKTRAALVALAPLVIVGAALLLHNYARFRDPLQFGLDYQLTYMPMAERRICGACSVPEVMRLLHSASIYSFNEPVFYGKFPFVDMRGSLLDPDVSFYKFADQVAGVVPYAPLATLGTLFAVLLLLRKEGKDARFKAGLLTLAAGWLVLLALSTCWFVSARYEIDFWFLLSAGGIVCFEAGLGFLAASGIQIRPLRAIVIVVALSTSVLGLMLGFRGPNGAFSHGNPALYERLSK